MKITHKHAPHVTFRSKAYFSSENPHSTWKLSQNVQHVTSCLRQWFGSGILEGAVMNIRAPNFLHKPIKSPFSSAAMSDVSFEASTRPDSLSFDSIPLQYPMLFHALFKGILDRGVK